MRKLIYLLLIFSFEVNAQVSINKEYSSTAVNFLNLITDAQSYSLGGGVSTTPSTSNVCQNISKSTFLNKTFSFSFSYHPWMRNIISDMNLTHLSSIYKIDNYSAIFLSYSHLNLGKIDKYSTSKTFIGRNIGYEALLNISYARKVAKNLSLGVSVKYISSNIDPEIKSSALASDISSFYTNSILKGKINLGFVISNIGGKMKYSNEKYFLPMTSKLALSYEYSFDSVNILGINTELSKLMISSSDRSLSNINSNRTLIGIQKDDTVLESFIKSINEKTLSSFSISSEYIYKESFFGRCGLKFYNNSDKMILLGVGIEKYGFLIDLAYSFHVDNKLQLNDNIFVTFSFNI